MKLRHLGLIAALLLGMQMPASAAVVYDNLGTGSNQNGLQMTSSAGGTSGIGAAADDFTLGGQGILTGLSFYSLDTPGNVWNNATLNLRILGNSSGNQPDNGNILYSANLASSASRSATGFNPVVSGVQYNEYLWNVNLPNISLAAGTYWLSLYLGDYASPGRILWEYGPGNFGNSAQVQPAGSTSWFATGQNTAFSLQGSVVPVPATISLILGGLFLLRRRMVSSAA